MKIDDNTKKILMIGGILLVIFLFRDEISQGIRSLTGDTSAGGLGDASGGSETGGGVTGDSTGDSTGAGAVASTGDSVVSGLDINTDNYLTDIYGNERTNYINDIFTATQSLNQLIGSEIYTASLDNDSKNLEIMLNSNLSDTSKQEAYDILFRGGIATYNKDNLTSLANTSIGGYTIFNVTNEGNLGTVPQGIGFTIGTNTYDAEGNWLFNIGTKEYPDDFKNKIIESSPLINKMSQALNLKPKDNSSSLDNRISNANIISKTSPPPPPAKSSGGSGGKSSTGKTKVSSSGGTSTGQTKVSNNSQGLTSKYNISVKTEKPSAVKSVLNKYSGLIGGNSSSSGIKLSIPKK